MYRVLNADSEEVARYELLSHALESAEWNANAGDPERLDEYIVVDENDAFRGGWRAAAGDGAEEITPED